VTGALSPDPRARGLDDRYSGRTAVERALDFANEVLILERRRNVWCGAAPVLRDDSAVIERHLGVSALHS
jgi:hypothetical protein